jgi:hypothetical protein
MKTAEIHDGTWTLRVTVLKDGIWRTLVNKSWVTDVRFRQARFVFVGGSTVVVSSTDLRRACDASKIPSDLLYSLHFDLENGTINNQSALFQIEA